MLNRSDDIREALYNDRAVGPAWKIQLPREAVTRLHGLMVDLDADLLLPNRWFPPAATAEKFYAAIAPALARHQILRYAEIRNTGRWLHANVRFREPIELRSAADQERWTAMHKVLMASAPSDPAAPALIGLTRPIGSANAKTGGTVTMIKPGSPITGEVFQAWIDGLTAKPFEVIGLPLFGERRITPCPFCNGQGSHLDLVDVAGMCYGRCRRVPVSRIFQPFFANKVERQAKKTQQDTASAKVRGFPETITIDGRAMVEIDSTTGDMIIRVPKKY